MFPKGKGKMKVKYAAQVLSNTVAASLELHVALASLPTTALASSFFVGLCNKLFDSLNLLEITSNTDEAGVITNSQAAFWKRATEEILSWKFYPKRDGQRNIGKLPFQSGWITTMNGMEDLLEMVHVFDIHVLSPRKINQDALENLFGLIRSHCGCNVHPTTSQFISALKTCIVNGLSSCDLLRGTNCESDDASLLCRLKKFICGNDVQDSGPLTGSSSSNEPLSVPDTVSTEEDSSTVAINWSQISVAYIAGFVARRVLRNVMCNVCKSRLLAEEPHLYLHSGISFREYSSEVQNLTYPSEDLVNVVVQGADIAENMLKADRSKPCILQRIKTSISQKVDFEWLYVVSECESESQHLDHAPKIQNLICEAIAKIAVPWWCKVLNRDIKWGRVSFSADF